MMLDERRKMIQIAIDKINKEFGKGSIMSLEDKMSLHNVELISTGAISVDKALGGGIPKGRVIELFGPESSGKTTMALSIVKKVQDFGGSAAYIDVEHSFDLIYAKNLGINLSTLFVSQPDSGDDALNIADAIANSGIFDLIVIDSVAALVPKCEIEGNIGDSSMGAQARLIAQALRKLIPVLSKNNVTLLLVNQIREKMGVTYGSSEITPGGRSIKFCASVRIEIRRMAYIKKGEEEIGIKSRVKIVKNKIATPFKVGEIEILFGKGISEEGSIIDAAINAKIIEKRGSWFSYKLENLSQGKEGLRLLLENNVDLKNKILEELNANIAVETC